MPLSSAGFARVFGLSTLVLALAAPAAAHADEPAGGAMVATTRSYYANEMTTSFLFMGYGAVTAGAGAASLTQDGEWSRGFGWSSLIAGGLTVLGGAAYGVAVKVRGDYYEGLAAKDPAQFKREESDRLEGTNKRFILYLGSEILETLAGIGIATYGFVAKDDLYKGIGAGAAIQGIGLFVIDAPGAGRAAKYQDDVRRFEPKIGMSVGGGNRPWAATVGHSF
ncbi:MAG: hypothetical protein JWP87_91 [Labilithrix sp.]|nr:hypothetical protein [Labilithrix sp.]